MLRARVMRALPGAAIVLLWLATTAWMARYEWFPDRFTSSMRGYWGLLREGPLVLDQWMRIDFKGKPVGYTHTEVESARKDGAEESLVRNQTIVYLPVLGEQRRMTVSAEARLDAAYRLVSFEMETYARPYSFSVKGLRAAGRRFAVTIRTGSSQSRVDVEIPDDAVLYSPMTEMAMRSLAPGQTLLVRTFDPLSMKASDVHVRAEAREAIRVGGRERQATRLSLSYGGMELRCWVDGDGRVLRQETPFGWTITASSADEVLGLDISGGGDDLLAGVAVPVSGALPADPRRAGSMRLELCGPGDAAGMKLATSTQTVLGRDGDCVELLRTRLPAADAAPESLSDAERAAALQATPFVQAAHPEIVAKAAEVTREAATPEAKADAITDFVFGYVHKTSSINLPSALDVLKRAQGDCNEHTYLAVALARAAGLPARIKVGLVLTEGALYYHAWPAYWLGGRWVEADPTFGQRRADAARVSLIEGELAQQLALLGVIGRMKAEILEARDDPY